MCLHYFGDFWLFLKFVELCKLCYFLCLWLFFFNLQFLLRRDNYCFHFYQNFFLLFIFFLISFFLLFNFFLISFFWHLFIFLNIIDLFNLIIFLSIFYLSIFYLLLIFRFLLFYLQLSIFDLFFPLQLLIGLFKFP